MKQAILQVVCGAVWLLVTSSNAATYIRESFSDATNIGDFERVVVDNRTGRLYLGAVNKLYKLTETLTQEQSLTTGPEQDSPKCIKDDDSCPDRVPTNCITKVMVIDYSAEKLIHCMNLYQGFCAIRKLGDITQSDPPNYKPLVANDDTSPAVMFIGPGPPDPATTNVLYIGATRTVLTDSIYRDYIPTVSSINPSTFSLAGDNLQGGTQKFIDTHNRDTFFVYYKYGFTSGLFSYFLTVQRESLTINSAKYVTRLVRVCHGDENFYSYTEVPLECNHSGTSYNLAQTAYVAKAGNDLGKSLGMPNNEEALFVAFATGQTKDPDSNSALCVFPMRQVVGKFTENIKECFKGLGNTGPGHIATTKICTKSDWTIDDDYCGAHDFNQPIAGNIPIVGKAVITFPTTLVTSLAVTYTSNTVTNQYTVAFMGTSTGHLKKVVIETKDRAEEYEDVVIEEGEPIKKDMPFDRSKKHLYIMTNKKISRVKVQDCGQHTSCDTCLGPTTRDPYCGWCSLENKCSLKSECQGSESTTRWLPYIGTQCTRITSVSPHQAQIEREPTKLSLQITNLPQDGALIGQYQCAFSIGEDPLTTPTSLTSTGVECETPSPHLLPPIPTGKDHFVMTLSVRLNNKDFVSTNFTFFKCGQHSSCTACTLSAFPCTWCVQRHKCTKHSDTCLSDVLVTGKNSPGTSDRPGPESCPRIEAGFTEILVSSGSSKIVSVRAVNLMDFQTDFKCTFTLDGLQTVPATRTNNIIRCDGKRFEYSVNTPYHNVPFKITWGPQNRPLDNPTDIQVKIYKCGTMASNCGECLTRDPKYNCGWCQQTGVCSKEDKCISQWRDGNSVCDNPIITQFYPKSGPTKGGTNVTIEGINLGKHADDIKDQVTIADVPCYVFTDLYEPASKIVCRSGSSTRREKSGVVQVVVNNQVIAKSTQEFFYVQPAITRIFPAKGPKSGGTKLTIYGQSMNAGANISARINGLSCKMISAYSDRAVCITTRSPRRQSAVVSMTFDNDNIQGPIGSEFSYVADPNITEVNSPLGIISGGLSIKVSGTNLDSIQEPKMIVYVEDMEFSSDCQVLSSTSMNCKSPNTNPSGYLNSPLTPPLQASYGFLLDNVKAMRNITADPRFGKFTIHADPEFELFPQGVKYFQEKNEYLTINGNNLDKLKKEDVQVKIGTGYCNVTSIALTQMTCRPPDKQPTAENTKWPKVIIVIGSNLTFTIGDLSYEQPSSMVLPLNIIIIIALVVILVPAIVVIIGVVCYKKKSKERDRVMKKMQTQMDVLESRVAKECKEAFAELQTDITELTSDMSGMVGIPFKDYRSFVMNVLFPNVDEYDHPVTRDLDVDLIKNDGMQKGLRQFRQLMYNKTFLLLFVRTLENHKSFTMRDMVNVASLISVALQNRMEYQTDILKTLLSELIEKSMEGRTQNAKLLLRRNERVAEKMLTNWFTFLLYKFLSECAGEHLYKLFRAIKQQVDKGPVDALSSEAKYSLSEDKLIRQQIDYHIMTTNLVEADSQYSDQEYPVKVLDCDTITQVKEKILDAIYRNAPFSSRPHHEDLDLEWRNGVRGRMILQDEDLTTKVESGDYKKINTLAHYKVPDGAIMALIPRQPSGYNMSLLSDKSGASNRYDSVLYYSMSGSPAMSRSVSPNTVSVDIEGPGSKYYHLVKPHDSEKEKEGDRGSKMVSEIYLTRLLATKGTLQQFVDDLFETIFSVTHRGTVLPIAIKNMFDFLDDQALLHGVADPEVVHTWKSNSLPLRFWVNIIKNPNFVFDIHKSNIVDSCLSVVAQTFMDSCSMSEHRLGKDSPSSKLLYAKDIPKYKKWVEGYYREIKLMPAISDQDMNAMLADESRQHTEIFNIDAAMYELYQYAVKYYEDLMATLEDDEFARKNRLAYKFEQVQACFESNA
ncbi:unnamed protein product [Owenia fusiformis]|uniref:Sema domain-containing protein n=1 Tax=Owenia fusiformis TaxID=6347 RepID=A0A8S4NSC0_OWEFU|nr:unnamed protein product [Owenia fusiformis]